MIKKKCCHLFFVRHGERQDDVEIKKSDPIFFKNDPGLTPQGKIQASKAGDLIKNFLPL